MLASRFAPLSVLLVAAPLLAAEGLPKERMTNDRQIIDSLAKIHDRGAALFNAGDANGCYRLFQGSLHTVKLVLPKELQEAVEQGMARADREPDTIRRAMVLHEVIEDVRRKLHPTAGKLEVLPNPRPAMTEADPPMPLPIGPVRPQPVRPGEAATLVEEAPKLTPEPAAPLGPMTPEPPKAPVSAPGRIKIDPPPPVISGVPTSNTKPAKPKSAPPDDLLPEPLSVPPRPDVPPLPPTKDSPPSPPTIPLPAKDSTPGALTVPPLPKDTTPTTPTIPPPPKDSAPAKRSPTSPPAATKPAPPSPPDLELDLPPPPPEKKKDAGK